MKRNLKRIVFWFTLVFGAIAIIDQLQRPAEQRDWHGDVYGVPYDFRPPTPARLRSRWWNPEDPRLFTPRTFGVGWDINLHRLLQLSKQALSAQPQTKTY